MKKICIFGLQELLMRDKLYIIIFLVFSLITGNASLSAQNTGSGVPFITNYSNDQYNAGNQNFAVIQDNRGVMYFGSSAILEFDGTGWRQIYTPNLSYTYSLAKDKNGRIYVGASNGELGYLGADSVGNLKYISLRNKIPKAKRQFTRVRAIEPLENEILFVTPLALYVMKNDTFKVIDVQDPEGMNRFITPFKIKGKIYIQERDYGVWSYKNGELEFMPGSEELKNRWITGMFPHKNDSLMVVVYKSTPYSYKNGTFNEAVISEGLKGLYTSSKYKTDYYLTGFLDQGIMITDKELNILSHISDTKGLQSNTVFNVYADKAQNIWAALGNGISYINVNSPFTVFNDRFGLSGTSYSSVKKDSILYISSSTGVFYTDWENSDPLKHKKFKPVENSAGAFQVWKTDTINGQVLCAGTSGFFYIKNGKAEYILEDQSIRTFIRLKKQPNVMIAGGGTGLTVYEFKNNKWNYKNKVSGFIEDCKHIEECKDGYIWISNQNKGIFRVKIAESLDTVKHKKLYNNKNGLPSDIGNFVFKIDGKVVFATDSGIYRYDNKHDTMIFHQDYEKYFGRKKITNMLQTPNGDIWFKEELQDPKQKNIKHWELARLKRQKDSFEIIRKPFLKIRNNIHSINLISEDELIIGTEKGFVHYNLSYKKQFNQDFNVLIRKIETISGDSLIFGGTFLDSAGIPQAKQPKNMRPILEYDYNGLRFSFSALYYEQPELNMYKFILVGDDKEEWSDWTHKTEKEYSNLGPGKYTFKVIAKNLYGTESEITSYDFEILPPWYQTVWAYLIYFGIFILFVWAIVQLSIRRVKKQKENLERIVEERTTEIQQKNQELSAMNEEISQKNKDITSSINYAKRIQEAMLPLESTIKQGLDDYFILFKPRDIVSGDFYWYAKKGDKIIITAVDCTGHGVPGAFMSMIGSEILTTIVSKGITDAGEILKQMNRYVVTALKQKETSNQDGMDTALCVIDKKKKQVQFAGAKNPLLYITDGKIHKIKGDKKAIGGGRKLKSQGEDYESHIIEYESPTWFYVFSDGYQDQFGGPKNRKFMIKRLKNILLENHKKDMQEQHKVLENSINEWMQNTEQTDDIILIGFKL